MADNVTITAAANSTPPDGTVIATDDVLGVQYQYVKLVDGTADSSAKIGGDASNGLDVDVTRVVPGTTASALGKAEDAAHTSGDVGVMALGVRNDTRAALATTDGDYSPPQLNASGDLRVETAIAHAPAATTMQNGATADGNGTNLAVSGYASAILNVVSSVAMSGGTTINFEASVDDTTWVSIQAHLIGSSTIATTTTADGDFRVSCAGYKSLRARISAYSAGTITVKGYPSILLSQPFSLATVAAVTTITNVVHVDDNASTLSVDDGGGALTVDNGGTFAVQVSSALPAGANAIGKLAANSGVDIGDVDVTSVVPGTGATSLGKAEDAAHSSGDTGVMLLAVREATATDLSAGGTDGDYEPLQVDASGRLHVNAGTVTVASHAVTNAGTFAVQVDGSALTALQKIDDPVLVDDAAFTPATSSVMMMGAQLDDAATDSVDEGDAGAVRMSANRNLYVRVRDNAGNERGLNIDANGALAATVTNATASNLNAQVVGELAHDAASDTANPVKIGAKAIAALSGATLVSAADRTQLYAGVDGVLIVRNHCNLEDIVSANATNTDGTSTQCIAAQAAGVKTYLTCVEIANTSASTVTVDIKDGTSVKWTLIAPAGGGNKVTFDPPLGGTAATAWNFDPSAAATTITCSMLGFKSKV